MPNKRPSEKLRVLLADDDEDDRLLFCEALQGSKIDIDLDTVHDGHDLMTHLRDEANLPDLIFLDLNMPKMTGMECLVEIRADERLRKVAIAIYSTSANKVEVDEAFIKGANIYINKTPHFEKLKSIIAEVLELNWQYNTSKLDREQFLIVR